MKAKLLLEPGIVMIMCCGITRCLTIPMEMDMEITDTEGYDKIEKRQNKLDITNHVVETGPFGGEGGNTFTDGGAVHLNGLPSKIEFRTGSRLDAIKFSYGGVEAENHGGGGGNSHVCQLRATEKILIVQGRAGSNIDEIEFIGDAGTICGPFGGGGGDAFVSSVSGCWLSYISGRSGSRIDQLTFHWECPDKVTA